MSRPDSPGLAETLRAACFRIDRELTAEILAHRETKAQLEAAHQELEGAREAERRDSWRQWIEALRAKLEPETMTALLRDLDDTLEAEDAERIVAEGLPEDAPEEPTEAPHAPEERQPETEAHRALAEAMGGAGAPQQAEGGDHDQAGR